VEADVERQNLALDENTFAIHKKRVEQSFGWMKTIGMLKKVKLRGIDKVGLLFTFTGAAYNLCGLRNLMART
jgi:hypothetical protein